MPSPTLHPANLVIVLGENASPSFRSSEHSKHAIHKALIFLCRNVFTHNSAIKFLVLIKEKKF